LYWPRDPYGAGNPALKPEQSTHADCGFQARTVSGPATTLARITAYRMQMRDMIIWQPDPSDPSGMRWTPSNLAGAVIRGIHGTVELSYGKEFSSILGAVWNDARDEKSNKVLIYRPAYVVTFSQNVAINRVTGGMTCRYMSSVFTNDQNSATLPECTVFDARLGVGLFSSPDDNKSVRLIYEILNVTDVQHYTNEGYPLPGREHRLSLKVSF
jgi:outer membrane cobalamin receptor